jgi:hypothetical protein
MYNTTTWAFQLKWFLICDTILGTKGKIPGVMLCPVCRQIEADGFPAGKDQAGFNCKVCGWFTISGTALAALQSEAAYREIGTSFRVLSATLPRQEVHSV